MRICSSDAFNARVLFVCTAVAQTAQYKGTGSAPGPVCWTSAGPLWLSHALFLSPANHETLRPPDVLLDTTCMLVFKSDFLDKSNRLRHWCHQDTAIKQH